MTTFFYKDAILFTVIAADLAIGIWILLHNPWRIINWALFLFTLGVAIYGTGIALLFSTHLFLFDKIILYGGLLIFLGLLLLSKTFPNEKLLGKNFLLILVPWLITAAVIPWNFIVRGIYLDAQGHVQPMFGPLFPAFILVFGIYAIFILASLAKQYSKLSGLARLQMQYLFFGIVLFIVSMFAFNVILPAIGIAELNFVGPIASIFFVGSVGYAIIQHQLLDIRVVIQRSAIYSLLFITATGIYLLLVSGLEYLLEKTMDITALVSAGLTFILGIFGMPVLDKYFRKTTDRIFFKDRYEYAEAMHNVSEILNKNLDIKKLTIGLVGALKKIFRNEKVDISLINNHPMLSEKTGRRARARIYSPKFLEELEQRPDVISHSTVAREIYHKDISNRYLGNPAEIERLAQHKGIEIIVPIILEKKLIGILTMGRKLSGDTYTNDDVKLLRTLSYQIAVAMERASLYKKVKDYSLELEKRVKERTAELEQLQQEQKRMMIDIAHALQAPLTITKTELETLRRQIPANKNLDMFEKSIDNVSKWIYDLLRLARLEATTRNPPGELMNLSRLLSDVAEYFTTLAADRGVTVITNVESDISLRGDKDQIQELVTNLLSNALKYMANKKNKKVEIGLRKTNKNIELTVSDNGIGIGKKICPIFLIRFTE